MVEAQKQEKTATEAVFRVQEASRLAQVRIVPAARVFEGVEKAYNAIRNIVDHVQNKIIPIFMESGILSEAAKKEDPESRRAAFDSAIKLASRDIQQLNRMNFFDPENKRWLNNRFRTIKANLEKEAEGSVEAAVSFHSVLIQYKKFRESYDKTSPVFSGISTDAHNLSSPMARERILLQVRNARQSARAYEENSIAFLRNPSLVREKSLNARKENYDQCFSSVQKAILMLEWSKNFEKQANASLESPDAIGVINTLRRIADFEGIYGKASYGKVDELNSMAINFSNAEKALRVMIGKYDPGVQFQRRAMKGLVAKAGTPEIRALSRMLVLGGKGGQLMIDRAYEIAWPEMIDNPRYIKNERDWDRLIYAALRHNRRVRDGFSANFMVIETKAGPDNKLVPILDERGKPKTTALFENKTVRALQEDRDKVIMMLSRARLASGSERMELLKKARGLHSESESKFAEVYTRNLEAHQLDEKWKTMRWHQKTWDWTKRHAWTLADGAVLVAGGVAVIGTFGTATPLVVAGESAYWVGRGGMKIAEDYIQSGGFTLKGTLTGIAMMIPGAGKIALSALKPALIAGKFANTVKVINTATAASGAGMMGHGAYSLGTQIIGCWKYGFRGYTSEIIEGAIFTAYGAKSFISGAPGKRARTRAGVEERTAFYEQVRIGSGKVEEVPEYLKGIIEERKQMREEAERKAEAAAMPEFVPKPARAESEPARGLTSEIFERMPEAAKKRLYEQSSPQYPVLFRNYGQFLNVMREYLGAKAAGMTQAHTFTSFAEARIARSKAAGAVTTKQTTIADIPNLYLQAGESYARIARLRREKAPEIEIAKEDAAYQKLLRSLTQRMPERKISDIQQEVSRDAAMIENRQNAENIAKEMARTHPLEELKERAASNRETAEKARNEAEALSRRARRYKDEFGETLGYWMILKQAANKMQDALANERSAQALEIGIPKVEKVVKITAVLGKRRAAAAEEKLVEKPAIKEQPLEAAVAEATNNLMGILRVGQQQMAAVGAGGAVVTTPLTGPGVVKRAATVTKVEGPSARAKAQATEMLPEVKPKEGKPEPTPYEIYQQNRQMVSDEVAALKNIGTEYQRLYREGGQHALAEYFKRKGMDVKKGADSIKQLQKDPKSNANELNTIYQEYLKAARTAINNRLNIRPEEFIPSERVYDVIVNGNFRQQLQSFIGAEIEGPIYMRLMKGSSGVSHLLRFNTKEGKEMTVFMKPMSGKPDILMMNSLRAGGSLIPQYKTYAFRNSRGRIGEYALSLDVRLMPGIDSAVSYKAFERTELPYTRSLVESLDADLNSQVPASARSLGYLSQLEITLGMQDNNMNNKFFVKTRGKLDTVRIDADIGFSYLSEAETASVYAGYMKAKIIALNKAMTSHLGKSLSRTQMSNFVNGFYDGVKAAQATAQTPAFQSRIVKLIGEYDGKIGPGRVAPELGGKITTNGKVNGKVQKLETEDPSNTGRIDMDKPAVTQSFKQRANWSSNQAQNFWRSVFGSLRQSGEGFDVSF